MGGTTCDPPKLLRLFSALTTPPQFLPTASGLQELRGGAEGAEGEVGGCDIQGGCHALGGEGSSAPGGVTVCPPGSFRAFVADSEEEEEEEGGSALLRRRSQTAEEKVRRGEGWGGHRVVLEGGGPRD